MILREHYMTHIRPFYESDLIKIITGIRRCGKSVILKQVLNELEAAGKRCLFLDFDLRPIRAKIPNADALIAYVNDYLGDDKLYVFLDEVQNVEGWNEAARTLRLYNTSVFITGSNSKLLSREFTKELSGRYVSFRIRPFVYREAKEYADQLGRSFEISDYLVWGGFPAALEQPDYFEACRGAIMETREWTKRQLETLGFTVLNSKANFLFASAPGMSGAAFQKALRERNILIRYFDLPRTKDYTRITIGDQAQMEAFIQAVKEILP